MENKMKKSAIGLLNTWKENNVPTWKNGRKGKAIGIGGVALFLMILAQCFVGESSGGLLPVLSALNASTECDEENEDTWKYTNETFGHSFWSMEASAEYEGLVYRHYMDSGIKVVEAWQDGYLVKNEWFGDDVVWVKTQKHYEDGETLKYGFYLRRGRTEVENEYGRMESVPRYVEVIDNDILAVVRKHVEEEEGTPLQVAVPVKSLCGFAIGTTFSRVERLFKSVSWNAGDLAMFGELVTPFRHCDEAELEFTTNHPSGGKHLTHVRLKGASPLETFEELCEEVRIIVAMLEKKFGIEFEKVRGNNYYAWEAQGDNNTIRQTIEVVTIGNKVIVDLRSDLMSPNSWQAWQDSLKPPKLSEDAGADLL